MSEPSIHSDSQLINDDMLQYKNSILNAENHFISPNSNSNKNVFSRETQSYSNESILDSIDYRHLKDLKNQLKLNKLGKNI